MGGAKRRKKKSLGLKKSRRLRTGTDCVFSSSANVDLQLPQVEEEEVEEVQLLPEPKPKFKERTITSLGGEQGGPAAFRKRPNGKARSLRARGEDD